jgi:hypothetical protein
MDFAKISNYTIEIYFVLFYFGQRLYLQGYSYILIPPSDLRYSSPRAAAILWQGTIVQSVYKRTYIKSAVELCGSILFLTELCQTVEAGKLDRYH